MPKVSQLGGAAEQCWPPPPLPLQAPPDASPRGVPQQEGGGRSRRALLCGQPAAWGPQSPPPADLVAAYRPGGTAHPCPCHLSNEAGDKGQNTGPWQF